MQGRCSVQLLRLGNREAQVLHTVEEAPHSARQILRLVTCVQAAPVVFEEVHENRRELLQCPLRGFLVEESEEGIHLVAKGPIRVDVLVKIHRLGSYFS
jgi:hypothetical protein